MSFLSKIFKSKPGGTKVGNLLRGVAGIAAEAGFPGASVVAKLLPAAPPAVLQTFTQSLSGVAGLPAQTFAVAKQLGLQAAEQAASSGANQDEQNEIANQVTTLAQKPADPVLVATLNDVPTTGNSLTSTDLKNIGGKILEGAKGGAVEGFMETDEGKAAKAEAVDQQITAMMPKVLIGLLVYIVFTKVTKK